jgi:hypothetical protein
MENMSQKAISIRRNGVANCVGTFCRWHWYTGILMPLMLSVVIGMAGRYFMPAVTGILLVIPISNQILNNDRVNYLIIINNM